MDPALGRPGTPHSWNRYQYGALNPVNYFDSNGLVELHFTFNAFIPTQDVWVPLVGVFEGDGPGFSASRTSARIQHRFTIETDPSISANPLISSSVGIGATRKIVDGIPGSPEFASSEGVSTEAARLFDGTILIDVRGHAKNPMVPVAPAIDYQYRLAITPDGKVICLTCQHDGFPAFDGYVAVGSGQAAPLFQHKAVSGWFAPFALAPPLPNRTISGVLYEFSGERWIDGVYIP